MPSSVVEKGDQLQPTTSLSCESLEKASATSAMPSSVVEKGDHLQPTTPKVPIPQDATSPSTARQKTPPLPEHRDIETSAMPSSVVEKGDPLQPTTSLSCEGLEKQVLQVLMFHPLSLRKAIKLQPTTSLSSESLEKASATSPMFILCR